MVLPAGPTVVFWQVYKRCHEQQSDLFGGLYLDGGANARVFVSVWVHVLQVSGSEEVCRSGSGPGVTLLFGPKQVLTQAFFFSSGLSSSFNFDRYTNAKVHAQ